MTKLKGEWPVIDPTRLSDAEQWAIGRFVEILLQTNDPELGISDHNRIVGPHKNVVHFAGAVITRELAPRIAPDTEILLLQLGVVANKL
jgi:hypothetical protein